VFVAAFIARGRPISLASSQRWKKGGVEAVSIDQIGPPALRTFVCDFAKLLVL
jgi:hypothetical protein